MVLWWTRFAVTLTLPTDWLQIHNIVSKRNHLIKKKAKKANKIAKRKERVTYVSKAERQMED